MKTPRVGMESRRHTPTFDSGPDDAYRLDRKLADPATCPKCKATYRAGRWTWEKAPPQAAPAECPACRRIADDYPGGWLTLKGAFFAEHRTQVLARVVARETHEKAEHPLQRIIAFDDRGPAETVVTTTDPHLAREIAAALKSAFKGTVALDFSLGENRVRATWER